jgi:hypothetical protein
VRDFGCAASSVDAVFTRDLRFGLSFISSFESSSAKVTANHYLIDLLPVRLARGHFVIWQSPGRGSTASRSPVWRQSMGRKLYVGNLAFSVTEEALSEKMSEFGTVESVKIITDRDSGQSKGFAFVEMASDSEANSVIDALNGTSFNGRPLRVNEARPQERTPRGGGRRW